MIRNTFIILEGIGLKKEKQLWASGIKAWNDFLSATSIKGITKQKKEKYDWQLEEAKQKLWTGNTSYFSEKLPMPEHWRLWDHFREEAGFLDIETGSYDGITIVGLYDGKETKTLIKGRTLDRQTLLQELNKFAIIVSFNGAAFDIPSLEKYFGFKLKIPHIDLRTVCKRLGYSGGLKKIESAMGIIRRKEVEGLLGGHADQLWNLWNTSGDSEWLERLVMYNEEDTINLKTLAEKTIPVLKEKVLA
ncbi:ribonuclease H-like domain-containing protein [Candidatus Woesearchaeota archaeon]|nr:ribonuclease H-like domain-containing protein [Candidatus Woesearchaeota archaeon]